MAKGLCKVDGVLGPRAMCGAVTVAGSLCSSMAKCPHKIELSVKQVQVLWALSKGKKVTLTEREHPDESKRVTCEIDADGLRAPLYTSMAVWALLRKGVLRVTDGKLERAK